MKFYCYTDDHKDGKGIRIGQIRINNNLIINNIDSKQLPIVKENKTIIKENMKMKEIDGLLI